MPVSRLNNIQRICFISQQNGINTAMAEFLESSYNLPLVFAKSATALKIDIYDLVLVDSSEQHLSDLLGLVANLQAEHPNSSVCLFAARQGDDLQQFLLLPVLKGVLFINQTNEILHKCIKAIDKGGYWFSRKQLGQLVGLREVSMLRKISYPDSLTRREQQVLNHIVKGRTNNEISELLFLSVHTIHTHRNNLYRKLGVKSRAGVILWAISHSH